MMPRNTPDEALLGGRHGQYTGKPTYPVPLGIFPKNVLNAVDLVGL